MNIPIVKNKGFTLIELIIVIIIMATVGLFVVSTLFLSLRGAAKTATIAKIRQNGNFAIAQYITNIRDAKTFGGINTDGSNIFPITSCTTPPSLPNTKVYIQL